MQSRSSWLESFLQRHQATAGSIHLRINDELQLDHHQNLPPEVLARVQTIPKGKGMAGLAWERHQPVTTCNLQTDTSGDVRPGARSVNASAAVALPVFQQNHIRAVVGIAWTDERTLDEAELTALLADAATLPTP